jgi:hypothetical protein
MKNVYNKVSFKDLQKKKERNAGIDLMRILGMYAIIIDHILLHGKILRKYQHYKELNLLLILCFWHVNSFALISGIVGYKTNKYSNIIYLWFHVLFYSISIYILFKIFYPKLTNNYNIIFFLFPVNFKAYWYFTEYFHMNLFIPIINKGINNLNKNELKIVAIGLFAIYIILKEIINPKANFLDKGYSLIWLLILYIAGGYFGKYIISNGKRTLIFYLINITIFIVSTLLCYYMHFCKEKKLKIIKNLFKLKFNSLAMILQVFSLMLISLHIKIHKILSKIICFFGPLTFGVYLIHDNRFMRAYFIRKIFNNYSSSLKVSYIILLIIIKGFQILCICLLIDFFRNIIFIILKIKKLCIIFDKIINNLIK